MKISDHIVFTCKKCNRQINPYGEAKLLTLTVEQAFNWMNNNLKCPDCNESHCWKYYSNIRKRTMGSHQSDIIRFLSSKVLELFLCNRFI